ncbi:cysteine--tRNA ligase, partial [Patescibacteria group bacterium]|nr:cysteine--tRNA ligase [Patescibacteria group bacterium]
MIKLYNTLGRKKQNFKSLKKNKVGLYTCGPTVYDYAHLGNLRSYLFADVLKRVLELNSYKVKHIINITDVGHLVSDEDSGEDKIEVGAKREKKTAWQIAEFYTKTFKEDLKKLNIQEPTKWTKASDYIKEQINLIKLLEKKGFTCRIEDGIYFETSKINDYGKLTGSKKRTHFARIEETKGKKSPTDFALWKFSTTKRQMEWNSPWGIGFPGWHTECVAMGIKELGLPFDIHTGGIDHIPVHHSNEIAQAEAGYNKKLANYWMHNEFLVLNKEKMAKSKGGFITLNTLIEKNINPLTYRYLTLTTHYKSPLSFSWKSLQSSQNALDNLYEKILEIKKEKIKDKLPREFLRYINDDLDTPKALALMWKLIRKKKISYKTILEFDKIFGLELDKVKEIKIPEKI